MKETLGHMTIQSLPRPRPTCVTVAVSLVVISSIIGITRLISAGDLITHKSSLLTYFWGFLVAWVILQGANWARWVCLMLIAVAVVDLMFSPAEIRWWLNQPAIEIAWFCFASLLSPVAMALLFSPTSNEWFRQKKSAA